MTKLLANVEHINRILEINLDSNVEACHDQAVVSERMNGKKGRGALSSQDSQKHSSQTSSSLEVCVRARAKRGALIDIHA